MWRSGPHTIAPQLPRSHVPTALSTRSTAHRKDEGTEGGRPGLRLSLLSRTAAPRGAQSPLLITSPTPHPRRRQEATRAPRRAGPTGGSRVRSHVDPSEASGRGTAARHTVSPAARSPVRPRAAPPVCAAAPPRAQHLQGLCAHGGRGHPLWLTRSSGFPGHVGKGLGRRAVRGRAAGWGGKVPAGKAEGPPPRRPSSPRGPRGSVQGLGPGGGQQFTQDVWFPGERCRLGQEISRGGGGTEPPDLCRPAPQVPLLLHSHPLAVGTLLSALGVSPKPL